MKTPATQAEAVVGSAVEERRLNLLRQIALAGGTIAPTAEPNAEHGYAYVALGDDVGRSLSLLARRNYLEERFFDRVSLCPKCGSHHLNVREICPGCRRAHLTSEGLLHHFRCGYVGIPSEFLLGVEAEGTYLCPKCNRKMHHPGTEYDRLGKAFRCHGCGLISENPPVEAVCFSCGARTPADDLVSTIVFSYVLTSRGAAAVRRGSLLDGDDDELVSIADAPVYRRTVLLEFLDYEMKRLQQFNSGFSVLLAECAPAAMDQRGDIAPAQWLTRLRDCLREVDRIGQLADRLYIVILPETKRRAAEGLRRRIQAELGPQSPLALSTVEITEPRDLAKVLAHNALGASS
jgi:DNA-directed RNA polymerase subunit RPC12/RpoP